MATYSALTPVGTQAIWDAWVVFALLLMPVLGQWEWLYLACVMGSAVLLSRDIADATPGDAVSPRLPPAGARSGAGGAVAGCFAARSGRASMPSAPSMAASSCSSARLVDFVISDEDMDALRGLRARDYGEHSAFPVYSGK
jgi:hypothetical protein